MTALSKKLGIARPHNGLRHSYFSYRLAVVKDANEASNSKSVSLIPANCLWAFITLVIQWP